MRELCKGAVKRVAAALGLEIRRLPRHGSDQPPTPPPDVPYRENPPAGANNFVRKMERVAGGGPLELPQMVALNETVAGMIGEARRIVELGAGTGMFAYRAAADPDVSVVASELNAEALAWARENRPRPNIRYVNRPVTAGDGPFDLVVSIEVIEHLVDYREFLQTCVGLAPQALLTTPNRNRSAEAATDGPPHYEDHVREWTAGEFYWVLRVFYENVRLFGMPRTRKVGAVPISVTSTLTPLIAICQDPRT